MQHPTRKIVLASTLTLVSVALLGGTKLLHPQGELAANPQPSSSTFNVVAHPLNSPDEPKSATKTRNEKFQKEADEANKRESVANKKAQQLFEEGHLAEAEQACYDALAVSLKINGESTDIVAKLLLGDIYRDQERYKKAIEVDQDALRHGTGDGVDLNLAWCYLKLGDLKNAHRFYSEEKFFADLPANQKNDDLSMLPGDKTPKTMEVSLLYARGCENDSHAEVEKANALWKKALELAPRNALAAYKIARNLDFLGKGDEAVPYWARAAVFGKGYVAQQGERALKNHLMPDKIEQALRDAQKIKG